MDSLLREFANGKSLEDIIRAISATSAHLLRARRNEFLVPDHLNYEVKRLLADAAKRLVSLRKKIASTGMDTILSDDEAMLLDRLAYDDLEPKADRLADHIGDKRDLERLLYNNYDQIEFCFKEAEIYDRSWWDCGADEGFAADCERLCIIKLCLLRNDILKDGIRMLLSANSIDLVDCLLSPNEPLRRVEFLDRAFGFRNPY